MLIEWTSTCDLSGYFTNRECCNNVCANATNTRTSARSLVIYGLVWCMWMCTRFASTHFFSWNNFMYRTEAVSLCLFNCQFMCSISQCTWSYLHFFGYLWSNWVIIEHVHIAGVHRAYCAFDTNFRPRNCLFIMKIKDGNEHSLTLLHCPAHGAKELISKTLTFCSFIRGWCKLHWNNEHVFIAYKLLHIGIGLTAGMENVRSYLCLVRHMSQNFMWLSCTYLGS